MNHVPTIIKINAAIDVIRHDDYTDSDVARLIELSPGHYFDLAIQYKVLESPHRTINALGRSLALMEKKDPLADYFLHRLAHGRYDTIILPVLKTPGQEKLIQDFIEHAIEKTHIPKLAGKAVEMANRFKTTQRLDKTDINNLCTRMTEKPHADSAPYESKFWTECRRSAQVRDVLLTLKDEEVNTVDMTHRKRALTSVFIRAFFEELGGEEKSDIKKCKSLFSLEKPDIQDSFNMAFSLTRDYLESSVPNASHPKEKIRADILDIGHTISHSIKTAFGITLDNPKRILNALDKFHGKTTVVSRANESLTHP